MKVCLRNSWVIVVVLISIQESAWSCGSRKVPQHRYDKMLELAEKERTENEALLSVGMAPKKPKLTHAVEWRLGEGLDSILSEPGERLDSEFLAAVGMSELNLYEKIQKAEALLQVKEARIKRENFGISSFYSEIVRPLNSLAIDSDWAVVNPRPTDFLTQWEDKVGSFHRSRYLLMQEKQAFYMRVTYKAFLDFLPSVSGEQKRKFAAEIEDIRKQFLLWERFSASIREDFVPEHANYRKHGFQNFTKGLRKLLAQLGQGQGYQTYLTTRDQLEWWRSVPFYIIGNILPTKLWLEHAISQSTPFVDGAIEKYPQYSTPTTLMIMDFLRKLSTYLGASVEVVGVNELSDRIPLNGISGRKVVNMFLPLHRGDQLDGVAVGFLSMLPHVIMFGNVQAYPVSNEIKNQLAQLPEFISSGGQKIEDRNGGQLRASNKFFQVLNRGVSCNVINFPQGYISDAGEILPIMDTFAHNNIYMMLRLGYEVNVIPISLHETSMFQSLTGSQDDKKVKVVVHEPITNLALRWMMEQQFGPIVPLETDVIVNPTHPEIRRPADKTKRYFEHFLASLWLESLEEPQNKELPIRVMMEQLSKDRLFGLEFKLSATVEELMSL